MTRTAHVWPLRHAYHTRGLEDGLGRLPVHVPYNLVLVDQHFFELTRKANGEESGQMRNTYTSIVTATRRVFPDELFNC